MKQFNEEVIFNGPTVFARLPREFAGTFTPGDTTPSVKDIRVWSGGGAVVTVIDFDDGAESQIIYIRGDGTTTIANNANIVTNTGANKLLTNNLIYIFVHIGGVWYESA